VPRTGEQMALIRVKRAMRASATMVVSEKHGGLEWSLRFVHRCKGSSSDGNTCRTRHFGPDA
jgi:hypothetical protein